MELIRIAALEGATPADHWDVTARLVEESPGRLRVQSCEMAPGGGAESHLHAGEDQMFVVLAGELAVEHEREETIVVREGEALRIPAGAPHATRNDGSAPARYLVLTFPTAITGEASPSVGGSG